MNFRRIRVWNSQKRVKTYMTRPVTRPMTHLVTRPMTRPITRPEKRLVTRPMTRPVTRIVTCPVTRPMPRQVTWPVTHPMTCLMTSSVTSQVTRLVSRPVTRSRLRRPKLPTLKWKMRVNLSWFPLKDTSTVPSTQVFKLWCLQVGQKIPFLAKKCNFLKNKNPSEKDPYMRFWAHLVAWCD